MTAVPMETTPASAKAWAPDVSAFAPTETVGQALIMQTSTILGAIQGDEPVLRVGYVDQARATVVAEGALLTPTAPTLAEVAVRTSKISLLIPMSNEQAHQQGATQAISAAAAAAVTAKADELYLAAPQPTDAATGPAAGLLNVAGITDAGNVSGSLDALVDAIAISEAAGGTPSHIVLDPLGWAELAKIRSEAGGAASLLGAGTQAAERLLLGLPVIVSRFCPARSGLVIDKTAVVSAVSQLEVAQSDHLYFAADATAFRVTWRVGQNVIHPERIARFTVGTDGK